MKQGLKQEIERILATPYLKRNLNEIIVALNKTILYGKEKIISIDKTIEKIDPNKKHGFTRDFQQGRIEGLIEFLKVLDNKKNIKEKK